VVGRGQYAELGPLLIWAVALSFIIPVAAIALVGKRTLQHATVKGTSPVEFQPGAVAEGTS
jgi:hypothetical protein